MYPPIPPTTGLEGGLQLTVKDGGPELENVILIGPGAGGMTAWCISSKCASMFACIIPQVYWHNVASYEVSILLSH